MLSELFVLFQIQAAFILRVSSQAILDCARWYILPSVVLLGFVLGCVVEAPGLCQHLPGLLENTIWSWSCCFIRCCFLRTFRENVSLHSEFIIILVLYSPLLLSHWQSLTLSITFGGLCISRCFSNVSVQTNVLDWGSFIVGMKGSVLFHSPAFDGYYTLQNLSNEAF